MKHKTEYRTVIEKSGMRNNDESVLYTNKEVKQEDLTSGNLVFSRPVFQIEFDAGYDCQNWPEETLLIDAFWRSKQGIGFWVNDAQQSPSKALACVIGNNFYDCMSGGVSGYELAIYRFLARDERIDKSTWVYADNTIQDFLDETDSRNIPNFEEIFSKLNGVTDTKFLFP